MQSPDFATSNRMLFAVIKNLKEKGMDKTKHYTPISENDLTKLQQPESFDLNDPQQLQQKVFYDIQLNFARRGRENIRELKKSSFTFDMDDSGTEFVELSYHESTKNHQTIEENPTKPRMYANGLITCPVNSLKLLLCKLDPMCDTLFTKSRFGKKFKPTSEEIWFTKKPLGVNSIGEIMKDISKRLKLSKIYTNHCIRATCVTILSNHGVEARHIMRVTGHKSESSLKSYNQDNSVSQKRAISHILSSTSSVSSTSTIGITPFSSSSSSSSVQQTHHSSTVVNNTNESETHQNVPVSSAMHLVISGNSHCTFHFHNN